MLLHSARGRRALRLAADIALTLVGAAAAWAALMMSAFCIGSSCPETLRVTWWAWVAIIAASTGAALMLHARTRRLGRALLVVPVVVAALEMSSGG